MKVAQRTYMFPASFAQERLWFLDQFARQRLPGDDERPDSFLYNIPSALRLRGKMHMTALRRSISELVRRHETLRTSFVTVNGRPMQSIVSDLALPLPLIDFSALAKDERTALIQQTARDEEQRPFDLARGPLVRSTLLRLDAEEHIFLLTLHHSIADAWSTDICFNELNMLYTAFAAGKPSPLVDLPIQYADYATWQREWLQGETLEQELTYWKKCLADAPAVLELPTDHPRPAVQTYSGARHYFRLSAALTKALEALSRKKDATLFMTLLAAFQTLLSRLSGQQDIVVGTPIAGRTQFELEGLIGLFVNTLVLRCDLFTNPPFDELLAQVRERALEAFEHQELPFDRLLDALQPERSLRFHPLFQVLFAFQNVPQVSSEQDMPTFQPVQLNMDVETAKFDLSLLFWEEEDGLCGVLEYNTDLFERATIVRWANHLQILLAGIVANPRQRIADLPLLREAERQQLLAWNATTSVSCPQGCLHERFEAQAARAPESIALVWEEQQITYGELNTRANHLAHYLQRLGVGPEVPVGLCLQRSSQMIVGILAILKAGGAYVPLDPAYPAERLAFQLKDAQVALVLTDHTSLAHLPASVARIVDLEGDWPLVAQEGAQPVSSGVLPEQLAYVIYTSGSTGHPKGVMVSHAQVTRLFAATDAWFHFDHQDCWTLFHSCAFDFSVWEIWGALLHGGRLVIVPYWQSRSPTAFADLLHAQQVTVLNQTPSAFRQLIGTEGSSQARGKLRWVIFGGETLDPQSLQPWFHRHGDEAPRLVNMYGITETTVHVTFYALTKGDLHRGGHSPLGRPLPDLQVYVLDAYGQPVPIGVVGEMYVGGAGLARGYLKRPELSAERFVPDPFSQEPGARLYKSGDRARYRPDGTLDYLGRADSQVKVRGFRIELGEIETVLVGHPQVQAAVVLLCEITQGDKRLVAYIVPEPEQAPTSLDLRAYLHERLPEFMVPAIFVQMEALPMTSNGKLDRRALPIPEWGQFTTQTFMAPRTQNEDILANIWTQVLRVKGLDINTNFFEAGGDSILSLLVIARAREAGLVFTPKQIFQYQTIAELAKVVVAATPVMNEQEAAGDQVPLTPIQRWFFDQGLPDPHHWNQSMLLEVTHSLINPQLLGQALVRLLEQHPALSLRFKHTAHGWEQYSADREAHIGDLVRIVDLSALPVDEQEGILQGEGTLAHASLHLTEGPLIRLVYFAMGERSSRLLIVIHHLVVDGVSWRILLEDLRAVCQQLLQNERTQLPQKTTSFKTWAERLQVYARSVEIQQEAAYWLAEERHRVAAMPVDFAADRSVNIEATVSSVDMSLSSAETDALLHKAAGAYHTQIHELLLTALVLACVPWTGKRSLLVDVEGHGREEVIEGVDLSHTIGWFTTIFPVLLDLESVPEGPGLGNAIKTIKEQIRSIPNNGIGYGLLRYFGDEDGVRAKLQEMPQAEISFNYLGQFGQLAQGPANTLFRPARESSGSAHSLRGRRGHLLDVIAIVEKGVFHVEWSYCTSFHRPETIEALARRYLETLRALIEHCCAPEAGGYTPSDFSGAGLSQAKLDKFMAKIRSHKQA